MQLWLKGYRLLAERYKCPVGEIDLVMGKLGQVIFVEVKLRKDLVGAAEAITQRQQARVIRAAQHWLMENPNYSDYDLRFDAVLVAKGAIPRVQHIKNAWQT